jgi:hypothetical protein
MSHRQAELERGRLHGARAQTWSSAASPVRLADNQGDVVAGANQRPQSGHG